MKGLFGGKFPDVTPAQAMAVAGWVAAQAVAYGWLTTQQSQLVLSAGATIVALAWKIADAFIRHGRNVGNSFPPPAPNPPAPPVA